MRLLLDTHIFLWFIGGDERLSETARSLIEDDQNQVYLSVASLWEMAIKISLGKLSLARPYETLIPEQIDQNQLELMGITLPHTTVVVSLPYHHRDPFDRMIIAQALTEQLTLVSGDPVFDLYEIDRVW